MAQLDSEEKWWETYGLTCLDLSMNSLRSIPEALEELSSLVTLRIGHNKLSRLPSSVVHLFELKQLDTPKYVRALNSRFGSGLSYDSGGCLCLCMVSLEMNQQSPASASRRPVHACNPGDPGRVFEPAASVA